MRYLGWVRGLPCAALFSWLLLGPASAQQCDNWNPFDCSHYAPGASLPTNPADRFPLGIKSPPDKTKLDYRTLYRIDVKCGATRPLPGPHEGLFARDDIFASHFIALTDQPLSSAQLPTQAKVLIPVYSVSTANANQSRFINQNCDTSFFISGREPLYIATTANQTETKTPALLTSLFFAGLKVVNPVWPLFTASAEAASILKPDIDGIAATEQPLADLFAKFDTAGTQTISAPLYVGEQQIRTAYSRTSIKATPIASVVGTNDNKFLVAFEDSLNGYADKLAGEPDETADANLCRRYGNQMLSTNFAGDDVAYGLTYVTINSGVPKTRTLACLGRQYALLSSGRFGKLWQRYQDPITPSDIQIYFADQPAPTIQKFSKPFFARLETVMAQAAANEPNLADPTRAELGKYLGDQIEVEDDMGYIAPQSSRMSSSDLIKLLADKSLTKFGCESKDAAAGGLFFAFPKDPAGNDGLYKVEDIYALRAWFGDSGKVEKIGISFEPGLVESVATPLLMWCGKGLHLKGEAQGDAKKAEPGKS